MTSPAEASRKGGSRGRLVWLALGLSLTLNVFFVGGLVWSHFNGPHMQGPLQRFRHVASELQLSGEERQAFQRFMTGMRQSGQQLREDNQPLFQRFWDELGKPQPDQALLAQTVDQIAQNRNVYQKHLTEGMTQFLATLTPEQRARFIEFDPAQPERSQALPAVGQALSATARDQRVTRSPGIESGRGKSRTWPRSSDRSSTPPRSAPRSRFR